MDGWLSTAIRHNVDQMKNHIDRYFIPLVSKVKKRLIGALLVCGFINTPLQAAEYFIDN